LDKPKTGCAMHLGNDMLELVGVIPPYCLLIMEC
jgi:hypothetical protein